MGEHLRICGDGILKSALEVCQVTYVLRPTIDPAKIAIIIFSGKEFLQLWLSAIYP